jgi:hypothetical protein
MGTLSAMDRSLPPPPPPSEEALQYTHSGGRYLLGFAESYFGIWDRTHTGAPVERFPRTSVGWQAAWRRYVALEPLHTEVALGSQHAVAPAATATMPPSAPSAPRAPGVGRPTHPAWWLLPILMGWMGGLIAWLLIREQDPARGRAMLVAGIVATVAWIVVYSVIVPVPPT